MTKLFIPLLALGLSFATSSCVAPPPENATAPSSTEVSTQANMSPAPELRTMPNGDIEIVFQGGCICTFDQNGNLKNGGRSCDDLDLHRARKAVKAHLAEKRANFSDV
ncbi:hypothetical protein HW115_09850 [Verrucomicrobiaceae bacterium N1E253]|uniref:Secreted protein n=1 Tax=Oceaniferula marina TaxID=2748318 RepID=A0A851GL63_9BACT|nr:hypothetical protein [Oceaniferula marina]NWK55915.1 hypothetical protein [Oceaniferula marina]